MTSMNKTFYTKEEIDKAKSIDLLQYLRATEPENLVKLSNGNYCTKEHDSLKISNGLWCWFSKEDDDTCKKIGGKDAVNYLIKVKKYDFTSAVKEVLSRFNMLNTDSKIEKEHKNNQFILPVPNENNTKATSYLYKRCIDIDLIEECIANKLIYEDEKHNVVFVGYDKNNIPKYAFVRGTNESRFMHDVAGSNKKYSFRLLSKNDVESIYLFESAIDLLSFATLLKLKGKNYKDYSLISLSGVYQTMKKTDSIKVPIAIEEYLKENEKIRKIFVCFDNDLTGLNAIKSLQETLKNNFEVIDLHPRFQNFNGKDYNDLLKFLKN